MADNHSARLRSFSKLLQFVQSLKKGKKKKKNLLREGQFSLKYPFIYLIIRHKCGIVNNDWKKEKKQSEPVLLHKA